MLKIKKEDFNNLTKCVLLNFEPLVLRLNNFYLLLKEGNKTDFNVQQRENWLFGCFLSALTKRKYSIYSVYFNKHTYAIFLGETNKIKKIYKTLKYLHKIHKNDHKMTGYLMGYPKCRIKNYCSFLNRKENFLITYAVAKDYIKKLNGIQDKFNIQISNDNGVTSKLQYIPCSPYCKESIRRITKINKFLSQFKKNV